jgi:hypothetical protein
LGDLVSTANQNRPETAAITATVLPAGAALVNGHRHGFGTVWTKRFGLLSFLPSFGYGLHRLHESRYVQNTVMDSYNNGNLGALVSTANQNRPETAAITATVLPAGTALVNGARHGFGTVWTKRFGLLSFIPSLGYGLHKVYETGYVQNKVMDSYNDGNLGALVSTVNEHPLTTTTVATAIPAALALTNGFMYGFTTQFTKRAGLLSGLPSLGYGLHWLHQAGYLQQAASTAIDWAKDTVFTYPSTAIGLTTGMIFGSEVGFPAFFLTYGANCVRNSWNEGYLGQFYTWSTSGWS